MNERIRRSRDSHEDYSYDRDLVEDNRGRSRRPPQYSDVCSQLSLEQLLEEDELFMSPTNNNNASMNEREHRGLNSNNKSRRRGIFDKYEEYHYGNDSEYDESLLQSTNRSYEELRARDEELFYKEDEDWTFITEEEYQAKATNKSQNKSNTEQLESTNLSKTEKLTESSENEKSVTPPLNVADLSSAEKLGEAMKRAALKLPKAVGKQLLAMVNPASLATMVGVLGAYAASHAVGIGIIADAVMAVGAGALIGWQAVTAAKDLWGFAQFVNATSEEELDKAGQHLANFVTTVGIDIVLGILTKRAAGKIKGAGNLDEANNSRPVMEGKRNTEPLTSAQVEEVKQYAEELGIPEDVLYFSENMDTSYGNMFGQEIVYVNSNIAPDPNPRISGITANDRISIKGSLAHEWIGHGGAGRAGHAFDRGTIEKLDEYNVALDEAQASIRAARFAPNLTPLERYTLLRDGIARLRKIGINIREVKDKLHINEP